MTAALAPSVTASELFDALTEEGYPNVTRSAVALAVRDGVGTPDEFADWEDEQSVTSVQPVRRGRIQWDD